MHITYRPANLPDVEHCLGSMLPTGFICEPEILAALPRLWSGWLAGGAANMAVLEERDQSGRERRVGFGYSVFVTESFAREIISSQVEPSIASAAACIALQGRSPVLTAAEVRRGNSAAGPGLNLLAFLIGWPPEAEDDPLLMSRIKAKLLEALGEMHTGYKLRRVMQEIYGIDELRRTQTVGARLFTDYHNFFGSHAPESSRHPYVVGIERETVRESSTLWPLFLYTPPIMFFSALEQQVLRLAVMGHIDRQIADTLAISASTVHKRWHALLRRAAVHSRIWLPAEMLQSDSEDGERGPQGRGTEKRRYLLQYLKSHPEELRPSVPTKPLPTQ